MAARIKKGDTVEILWGVGKGSRGTVQTMMLKEGKVIVAGRNLVKKHQKRNPQANQPGGIIDREAPLQLSRVAPVCRHCGQWTRVGMTVEDGHKVRVCKRKDCGKVMD